MRKSRRRKQTLWRWRSNPLRRRDDVVEAWIVLTVWTVIALGGTLVGALTAHAVDEAFIHQRVGLHPVRAVLIEDARSAVATTEDLSYARVLAKVRWQGTDGSAHIDRTLVDADHKAGSKVQVWTDSRGRLVAEPATSTEAATIAAFLGTAAALGLGGVAYAAGCGVRQRLDRRRIDQWTLEWDRVGPQWARKAG